MKNVRSSLHWQLHQGYDHFPRRHKICGWRSSRYAAHAAAQLGMKVAVVTRLAKRMTAWWTNSGKSGIDCFPTYTPHSTLMKLEYPTTNPDIRNLSVAATAGSITASRGGKPRRQSRRHRIQPARRGWSGCYRRLKEKDMLVAADMQGFVRVLRGNELKYEPWDEMQATLAHVDVVKSDAVEAEFLTGETDIFKAAKFFADMGPKGNRADSQGWCAHLCRWQIP